MAKHSKVKDEGAVFIINPNTRKVVVPTSHFVIGTVGEHLSEQVTFECPATIDGHDITACQRKYVTWLSVDGTIGHDELTDMTVADGVAHFKWNIRNGLTSAKGVVSFSVHFEDTENEETAYKFSTTTCKSCEILESLNAQLSTYEAIYVADDTLVIADYTAVDDDTLEINTNGLVPEGAIEISANGTYDVGVYASAKVEVIPASDPDLAPENIKKGVSIFGVEGTALTCSNVNGKIVVEGYENEATHRIIYQYVNQSGIITWGTAYLNGDSGLDADITALLGGFIIIESLVGTHRITPITGVSPIIYDCDEYGWTADNRIVVRVIEKDFNITASHYGGAG